MQEMNTMQETMPIFEEIISEIGEYGKDPSREALKRLQVLISLLPDAMDRADAMRALLVWKAHHKLTQTELSRGVAGLIKERAALEAPWFAGDRFLPDVACVAILEKNEYLTCAGEGALRIYKGGVYKKDTTHETRNQVRELLGSQRTTPSRIDAVMSLLRDRTTREILPDTGGVNLLNGMLSLNTWELLPHDPSYDSIIQLPVSFDKDAVCPCFEGWLEEVLPSDEDKWMLLEMMGYCLLQDVRFGKILYLYGPTHTGKSTFLEVLKAFLGQENVSSVTWHALDDEGQRFTRSRLVGKLANVSGDLSSKYLAGDSQIKQLATGDSLSVEFKGKQGFDFKPFATLIASGNQLPMSRDRTDAWYERLVILPFTQQHKGAAARRDYVRELTTPDELSGILTLVVVALKRLLERNEFLKTASTEESLEAYKALNDHVKRFLLETYTREPASRVKEAEVYEAYKVWCEDEGVTPLNKTKLREGVVAGGAIRKQTRTDKGREFVFEGLRLF